MKVIQKRLTYANVMSSIAVFLVLGGATAFAASKIGSNQLKANSVTTGKIKKNAVTAAKIKNGAVNGAKVKDGSLTGADINLGALGTVPTAANAEKVGGNTVQKIFYKVPPNTGAQTILSLNGLTLTAACGAGSALTATATTSVGDSLIHSGGTFGGAAAFYAELDDFDTAAKFDFLAEGTTTSDSIQGTLTYSQPTGAVVTAVFQAEEFGFDTEGCSITGFATAG